MQIILDSNTGDPWVQEWLDFNQIDYCQQDFWDLDINAYRLDLKIEHSIVVFNHKVLKNFADISALRTNQVDSLRQLLQQNNQIWFIGTDIAVTLTTSHMTDFVKDLDRDIAWGGIVLFLDAEPTDHCYLSRLQNIKIVVSSVNHCNKFLPRVQTKTLRKLDAAHSFLLTMIQKSSRPHRQMLWYQLNQRTALLSHGLTKCHVMGLVKDTEKYIGRQSHQHDWHDGHASMDLYSQCWLEIVPETCYRDLYYFTEKTQKPIMTQTPFLVVSTAGYLAWLRSQGFQTFGTLIDESYDMHHRVEDRIRRMLDVLEDIIHNGTQEFYHASEPVLQHNFSRLCELAGSWNYEFDCVMWRALEEAQPVVS